MGRFYRIGAVEALLVVLGAYLLGSVSFAIVVSRLAGLPDPRTYGSKNPGATNGLRTGKHVIAVLTLAGDTLKGFVRTFPKTLDEVDKVVTRHGIWVGRTVGLGVMSPEEAVNYGLTGPMRGASAP